LVYLLLFCVGRHMTCCSGPIPITHKWNPSPVRIALMREGLCNAMQLLNLLTFHQHLIPEPRAIGHEKSTETRVRARGAVRVWSIKVATFAVCVIVAGCEAIQGAAEYGSVRQGVPRLPAVSAVTRSHRVRRFRTDHGHFGSRSVRNGQIRHSLDVTGCGYRCLRRGGQHSMLANIGVADSSCGNSASPHLVGAGGMSAR
jgi:hypothetical protein